MVSGLAWAQQATFPAAAGLLILLTNEGDGAKRAALLRGSLPPIRGATPTKLKPHDGQKVGIVPPQRGEEAANMVLPSADKGEEQGEIPARGALIGAGHQPSNSGENGHENPKEDKDSLLPTRGDLTGSDSLQEKAAIDQQHPRMKGQNGDFFAFFDARFLPTLDFDETQSSPAFRKHAKPRVNQNLKKKTSLLLCLTIQTPFHPGEAPTGQEYADRIQVAEIACKATKESDLRNEQTLAYEPQDEGRNESNVYRDSKNAAGDCTLEEKGPKFVCHLPCSVEEKDIATNNQPDAETEDEYVNDSDEYADGTHAEDGADVYKLQ